MNLHTFQDMILEIMDDITQFATIQIVLKDLLALILQDLIKFTILSNIKPKNHFQSIKIHIYLIHSVLMILSQLADFIIFNKHFKILR